jgi:glycosyltransferase involved in cell wall biosynthesis
MKNKKEVNPMLVLIPAYEPNEKMLALIAELQEKTTYDILIVDDGSGESYQTLFQLAASCGCTVLHHRENKGKGAALKTGFTYLLAAGRTDGVVCADADGQHHVADIISVAQAVAAQQDVMVLGVREFQGKVPLKSRFGNRVTSFFFKRATGIALTDTQTGLRAYPAALLPWLCAVPGERFEYELNLLLAAGKSAIMMKQVPIATIYDNQNKGTHFRPLQDSVRVFLPIIKFGASSLTAGLLDFILLFVLQDLTGSLFWGVVLARILSSTFNYSVNKVLVFKAKHLSGKQSAPRYFGLVLVIMLANYGLLALLTKTAGVPDVPAKLLTEITLFALSYTVQKLFIFRRQQREGLPAKRKPYASTT